uniref:Uncharacterized protein n=1 Tax=Desertifilum tharense IPPAS B-1220 TaxID=1781255 RepID=A0A1E5QJ67_9CYAN|nr:hypothetical protein BH720_13675 [Desertifilum tharense IPPAS B-1220]
MRRLSGLQQTETFRGGELGIGSWGLGKKRMGGRRELGIGSWGLGKKDGGMGRWGDGGKEGSWELGVREE